MGKSTLFNSLSNAKAQAANFPFCTIEPNVGVITVPDERLTKLTEIVNPKSIVPNVIEIVDIAGPWHKSGSWWDGTKFDCDYWDVVTEQPAYMLRLQQEHTSKVWNVSGLYD